MILHIIAAFIWLLAALFAAHVGMALEKKEESSAAFGLAIWAVLAVIAFALQVLA